MNRFAVFGKIGSRYYPLLNEYLNYLNSFFKSEFVRRFLMYSSPAAFFLFIIFLIIPVSETRLKGNSALVLISLEGSPLRFFREKDSGAYSDWDELHMYPESLQKTVIRAEDKRFYYHPGIDPAAMLRSLYLNLIHFRIVSGASTITQQLVRIAYADQIPKNAFLRKIFEIIYSFRLEIHFTKNEILEAYLNRMPLKFNRMGFGAASRFIFQKSPEFLTEEESAALTVLLRQSSVAKKVFLARFNRLYAKLYDHPPDDEILNQILLDVFREENQEFANSPQFMNSSAPHFSQWISSRYNLEGSIQTHISTGLMNQISSILQSELETLQFHQAGNGAVVVFEIKKDRNIFKEKPSLILKAMAGSRDFNDPEEGQVNGALAVRNGGSTLKPFIYAMAMEKLNLSPYSIIDDSESEFEAGYDGMYRPKNYDLNYWGKLTLRESLAASRNIPAVKLLKAGGIEEFYELLKKMEVAHINHSPEYYGPGMALGTTGLSLFEITRLYSSFITEGVLLPVEIGSDEKKQKLHFGTEAQIFNSDTAYRITHILADSEIRKKAFGRRSFLDFPFEVAAKTGTSKDYRDSWTIGYTSNYIVGVWVGNFSGESMQNISGVYGAGRIFHQVIRLLEENPHHKFSYPSEWREISICRISGKRSGPHCPRQTEHLLRGDDSPELCSGTHDTENIPGSLDSGLKKMIQSPSQGEIYIIDPHSPDHYQQIPLKIILPQKDGYTIAVNGKIFNPENSVLTRMLTLNEGRHRIEVFKDGISVDSAEFEIQY